MRRGPRRRRSEGSARFVALLVAAVAALPLGFASLPSSASSGPGSSGAAPAPGTVRIAPAFVPGPGVRDLGPMPVGASVDVAVGLAPRDPAGLAAYTALEYTPGAPEYHHFLSASEVADRYGPSAASYRAAVAYLTAAGLSVQQSPDRLLLWADGNSSDVATAFHTSFEQYAVDGRVVFSHPTPALLPAGVPWAGAVGLGNVSPPRPAVLGPAPAGPIPAGGCSSTAPYAPCAVAAAYNSSGLVAGGANGTGFRIGVVDTYDGSESQSTLSSDLATFATDYGLSVGSVDYLYPIPTSHNLNATSTGWGVEEALDLEWSRAMAPGATIDMTFAPDATAGLYGAVDWLVAHQAVDVLSLSWGEPDVGTYNAWQGACTSACNATSDGSYTLLHPVLAEAAAEGIGIFSSSGDCGAADGTSGVATSYPASDPAVTGVGGTVLTLRNGTYSSETAWSGNSTGATSPGCANQGGSGGGFAPFPRPYWQRAGGVPTSPATRGVPDISLVGGSSVGIVYNGVSTAVAGTSAGAPMWAGFEALADSSAGAPLGNLDPALYQVARGSGAATAFHDITNGWNGYYAGTGWDPVTGLGTPNVGALVPRLTAGVLPPVNLTVTVGVSPRVGPPPLNVTFTVNGSGGAGPYPMIDVDFGDGDAALAVGSTVSHRYTTAGVYVAQAVVFDAAGNSSVSEPVPVVVGGRPLPVSLSASGLTTLPNVPVTLTASTSGGTAPYRYWYSFGDGTYLDNTTDTTVSHAYPYAGGFCATVVAIDAAHPADGGVSDRLALSVGGVSAACANAPPLVANLTSAVVRADLPGDLPLAVVAQGGVPPLSVRFVSDDPYVGACNCGIFRLAGNHTVTAFVNDSVNQEVVAHLNVTILPALTATFAHSGLTGRPPFSATFSDQAGGGNGTPASATHWTFGDGTSGLGASVTHTWASPGFYTVLGQLNDSTGGEASAAFEVDVLPLASVAPLTLTASVTPAVRTPAGTVATFSAGATGGTGPYLFRWQFSDNSSAFGPTVQETFSGGTCLANGTCPLSVTLSVTDSVGAHAATTITLPQFVHGRSSAASLAVHGGPTVGPTPLSFSAQATVTGMSGLAVVWAFGDGGAATGATVGYSFDSGGNYTVSATATDRWGDLLVRTLAVTAVGPTVLPPTILGGPNVTGGVAPLDVGFTVAATGGVAPYSFAWAFGDGTTGVGAAPNHTYSAAGTFLATVTVTDARGAANHTAFALVAYLRTPVTLTGSTDRGSVPAGGPVTVSLQATLVCTNVSAPGCAVNAVAIAFAFAPDGGGPSVPAGAATPGVTGVLRRTLTAPTVAGGYELTATVTGANFSGAVALPLTVTPAPTATLLLPFQIAPMTVLLAGLAIGLGAAAVTQLRGRRRPSPSPRRGGPGGRRAG